MRTKLIIAIAGLLTLSLLSGCATNANKDPLEGLNRGIYKFNDVVTLNKIKNLIGSREPRLKLLLTDNSNNILYESCYLPDSLSGRKASFYGIGEPKVFTIHGNEKESGVLTFAIKPEHNYIIQRANRVEVQIATDSQCP